VNAPAVPRDGKTVALSPADCRRLLDEPGKGAENLNPVDFRDKAMLAVLAYSGCRVGELVRLRVKDFKTNGEHRGIAITGKGGKERTCPLHPEAVERLATWLDQAAIREVGGGACRSKRGHGRHLGLEGPCAYNDD
jgi:integrase/recombinase XerD